MDPHTPPRASCIVAPNPENGDILAASRRNEPDQQVLPGGKEDEGEGSLACAIREFFEETGVQLLDPPMLLLQMVDSVGYFTSAYLVVSERDLQAIRAVYAKGARQIEPGITVSYTPFTRLLFGPFGYFNGHVLAALMRTLCRLLMTGPENGAPSQADVLSLLRSMGDEQRQGVFAKFCSACGSADPHCVSWRDE